MKQVTSSHIIVKRKDGKILLTRREDVPFWVIPGGHCQPGENPIDTAVRECREETGYLVRVENLIAQYTEKNALKNLYSGSLLKKINHHDRSEVNKMSWFSPSQLPRPLSLYEHTKIKDFLEYSGTTTYRPLLIQPKKEILNLLKNPIVFLYLLFFFVKNKLTKKSFKLPL